ncbi:MAG: hypothetical protein R2856_22470 [Caldilineaceae bacterium]
MGADRLGRDVLSRMIFGTRISMTIGLVGVTMSFVLGIALGGLSGYYGGILDDVIQRIIEFLRSIPDIPLWMGLAAALPSSWPPLRIYFGITIILSLIGWTGLKARWCADVFSRCAPKTSSCPPGWTATANGARSGYTWCRHSSATSSPRSHSRSQA